MWILEEGQRLGRSGVTPSESSICVTPTRPMPRTDIRSGVARDGTGAVNSRRIRASGRAASALNSMSVRECSGAQAPSSALASTTSRWSAGSVRT